MFGVDFTGIEALEGPIDDLRERNVDIRLARVRGPTLEKLQTSVVLAKLAEEIVLPRIEIAATVDS